jgi:hypothetical protein
MRQKECLRAYCERLFSGPSVSCFRDCLTTLIVFRTPFQHQSVGELDGGLEPNTHVYTKAALGCGLSTKTRQITQRSYAFPLCFNTLDL